MENIKILVLGAGGMLGNAIYSYFVSQGYSVQGTSSQGDTIIMPLMLQKETLHKDIENLLTSGDYTHVVNCIAELSSSPDKYENAVLVNAYFPKLMSMYAHKYNFYFYHIGTNGIFSGNTGPYSLHDVPDDISVYGMTKTLGEVSRKNSYTIRTSLIGIDMIAGKGLINWVIKQPEDSTIHGFTNVFWNGVTTLTLAHILEKLIQSEVSFDSRILHIAGETVSKFDILNLVNAVFQKNLQVIPDVTKHENRTLSSSLSKDFSDIYIPSLEIQLKNLHTFYFS